MLRYPNYTYLPLTTRENPGQSKVYIQDLIQSGELEERLGQKLDPDKTHVFLCGNPKMIGLAEKDRVTGHAGFPGRWEQWRCWRNGGFGAISRK